MEPLPLSRLCLCLLCQTRGFIGPWAAFLGSSLTATTSSGTRSTWPLGRVRSPFLPLPTRLDESDRVEACFERARPHSIHRSKSPFNSESYVSSKPSHVSVQTHLFGTGLVFFYKKYCIKLGSQLLYNNTPPQAVPLPPPPQHPLHRE